MKNVTLIFLMSFMLFSCVKNEIPEPAQTLPADVLSPNQSLAGATANPDLYLDLGYFASATRLSIDANIYWPDGVPGPEELPYYSIRFTVSGHKNSSAPEIGSVPVNATGATYNVTVVSTSSFTPKTITVKAELMKSNAVITTTTSSLTVTPAINASTSPIDSIATVSVNRPYSGSSYYEIKASNLIYLSRNPDKKLYFYAFFIPTQEQRVNQQMKTLFLGNVAISGSSFFSPEGSFQFSFPNTQYYDVSHIRVFISKTEYPLSYFTNSLINVGYETYLIDQCITDAVLYDVYTKGLDNTNGRFGSGSFPSYMTFAIGSMDRMLNTQIYILKARGVLW